MPEPLKYVDTLNSDPLLLSNASLLLFHNNQEVFLNENHCVILMINGFCFFYFELGEENPTVYYWSERMMASRKEGLLSDFLNSISYN